MRHLIPLFLALSGCHAATWDRSGVTDAQFKTDHYQCLREARVVLPGRDISSDDYATSGAGGLASGLNNAMSRSRITTDEELFNLCMETRGYSRTQ